MSTRALVRVKSNNGASTMVCIYVHGDGYPSALGEMLKEFLARRIVVNGISENYNPKTHSNGMGELAAQLVGWLRDNDICKAHGGWIYLYNDECGDVSQEYEYEIRLPKGMTWSLPRTGVEPILRCWESDGDGKHGNLLFDGKAKDWNTAETENDE